MEFVNDSSSMSLRQCQLDEGNRSLALIYPLENVIISNRKWRKMMLNCQRLPLDDGPTSITQKLNGSTMRSDKDPTMAIKDVMSEDINVSTSLVYNHLF